MSKQLIIRGADFSANRIGGTTPAVTYFAVSYALQHASCSTSVSRVRQGATLSFTIEAESGYDLQSVTVTMSGNAVAPSSGTSSFSIASVSGPVVISATATEAAVQPQVTTRTYTSSADSRFSDEVVIGLNTGYINCSTGATASNSTYSYTDHIPVSGFASARMKWHSAHAVALYDAQKNFLGGLITSMDGGYADYEEDFSIPAAINGTAVAYATFNLINGGKYPADGNWFVTLSTAEVTSSATLSTP